MKPDTHLKIDPSLCGTPVWLGDGRSRVELTPSEVMQADDTGLVHGGFVFGLADYAAMIAVNHPNVVLGAATVKFLKPVQVGHPLVAEAGVSRIDGKKHIVTVSVLCEAETVFAGEFICFVPETHVLTRARESGQDKLAAT